MKITLLTILFLALSLHIEGQEIMDPNYGLKTHSTLDLLEINRNDNSTIMHFRLLNLSTDGEFCVDDNTVIILPDGEELKLQSTRKIPTCPETHKFKSLNEVLNFTLSFPPIPKDVVSFDIFERCDEACFSFIAVVADKKVNEYLNIAHSYYERGRENESINLLQELLSKEEIVGTSLEGSIYNSIVAAYVSLGNLEEAKRWVNKLKISDTKYKEEFLRNIETIGID